MTGGILCTRPPLGPPAVGFADGFRSEWSWSLDEDVGVLDPGVHQVQAPTQSKVEGANSLTVDTFAQSAPEPNKVRLGVGVRLTSQVASGAV